MPFIIKSLRSKTCEWNHSQNILSIDTRLKCRKSYLHMIEHRMKCFMFGSYAELDVNIHKIFVTDNYFRCKVIFYRRHKPKGSFQNFTNKVLRREKTKKKKMFCFPGQKRMFILINYFANCSRSLERIWIEWWWWWLLSTPCIDRF